MAILPTPSIDYTDKDFDALRFRIRSLVRSVFPEWTDFNQANFGNLLIELFAHVGDVLTFYQDNQARQSRISTATQRRAMLGLVKLIGFTPSTASPAQADLSIALPATSAGDVLIPASSIVMTDEVTDPISYQLLEDALIIAGTVGPVTVTGENSEEQEDTFSSSGLPNQTFVLTRTPYIDASATFIAGDGTYTQVDNFLDSGPTDKHFTVSVDQNDKATIRTGNGVNGTVPVGNISTPYKTGGGVAGRVEANKLKRFQTNFTDTLGNPVQPTVTNPLKSSGGTDRQSVAQMKERAPATLRVLTRSVTKEDFEINALRLSDIARAMMLTSNEDSGVPENSGLLFVIPVDGGQPTEDQKDAVLEQVTVVYPCTLTFSVTVQGASFKTVNVTASVYIRKGQTKTVVAAAIRSALADFFAVMNSDGTVNTNVDFGANIKDDEGNVISELALSDVFNVVRDVPGVRKVGAGVADFLLNDSHDDVDLLSAEFPQLGTVTLTDGDTGLAL